MPRFFVDQPLLCAGAALVLSDGAARHVQVLRLQPDTAITLFDGSGGEWDATIESIGRREVGVRLGAHRAVDRELALRVTLALGMPANERMDAVIEKATELGVARIQPLVCERSVLRLSDERARKKVAHWQAVALAACEQCGRTRLPMIAPVETLAAWLRGPMTPTLPATEVHWLLSPGDATPLAGLALPAAAVVCLSGPEGGLSPLEEDAARAAGFAAISLGPRVLRADTAPLAVLAYLGLRAKG